MAQYPLERRNVFHQRLLKMAGVAKTEKQEM
jgi:hypothetical protein